MRPRTGTVSRGARVLVAILPIVVAAALLDVAPRRACETEGARDRSDASARRAAGSPGARPVGVRPDGRPERGAARPAARRFDRRSAGPRVSRGLGVAERSGPAAAAASSAFDRVVGPSALRLRRTHFRAGRLEVDVEGLDAVGGRAVALWRLDAPRGEPVLVARAESERDGALWFRSLLLPEQGALLVAAPPGRAPDPGAGEPGSGGAFRSPARPPQAPHIRCEGQRIVATPPGPGYALRLADDRGIPLLDPPQGPTRRAVTLAADAEPRLVASLRRDGAQSSWQLLDPALCSQGGP